MPQVRRLTVEEVRAISNRGKGQRKLVEEQYDAILSAYTAGEWGEATLEPGEHRLTVRNRLKAAARRRALELVFSRTGADVLRFKLVAPAAAAEQQVAVPARAPRRRGRAQTVVVLPLAPEPAAAPKRRGRRPNGSA